MVKITIYKMCKAFHSDVIVIGETALNIIIPKMRQDRGEMIYYALFQNV